MVYAIYTTENFDKEMMKLENPEQERIQKIFLQLKDNPYVGDPLRYKFLREKRIKEKRIYFLIYDDLMAVLIVALSDKKTQQEVIDHIVRDLDLFKSYLKEQIEKN